MALSKNERDMLVRIDERTERLDQARADHETRIRMVEKNFWIAAGAIMLLSVIVNIIF